MSRPRPDIPPPGHPIHDILRLTGVLPSNPSEPNVTLSRLREPLLNTSDISTPPQILPPLEALHKHISLFFSEGHERASIKFTALRTSIANGEMVVSRAAYPPAFMQRTIPEAVPWNSCKLAATLVLAHAAARNTKAMFEALKFQSRSLDGLPSVATINATPSADLAARFVQAKKAAIDGKLGQLTVLGVSLVDVEMIERGEKGSRDMAYTSFAHTFVLGIGREGFRVFQAWGEHGYRLDEYLDWGGSRLRSWKEAKDFIKTFKIVSVAKVRSPPRIIRISARTTHSMAC